jgi:hypothetical protein
MCSLCAPALLREQYVVLGVVRLTGVGIVISRSDCPKGTAAHLRTVVPRLLLGSEADDTEVVPPAVDNVARVSALLSRFPDLSIEATFDCLPRSFETLN